MASYTDQISTFNPYIQQLPTDAMMQVGMQKQAQYNQGVQKIQGQIDNIAGMDVVNDADKQYIQSKLNELGSNLKSVAAGDFSNQQLVNSVGGMATSIIKDQNVQNAVSSTSWYRKQLAEMEKQVTEGKSSVENIEDFNKQASAWLSSEKAGQVFRGRYSPYVDVKKKIMTDVIGKINPNLREEDIPWTINPDGTPNIGDIAAVMTRVSGEAVTAQQLQNAINASLNPADLNQLAISGRYQFKNATPEALANVAQNKYKKTEDSINEMITQLEGHANMSKSNAAEYNKTLESIDQLKAKKATLPSQLERELKWVSENPEEAKAEIYKDGFINSFAEAFSWEKKKKTILDNPYQNYKFKLEDQQLKKQKLDLDKQQFSWKQTMDVKNYDLEKDKYDLQLKKLYGDVNTPTAYLGESALVKDPKIAVMTDRDTSKDAYNNFIKTLAQKTGTTVAGAEQAIKDYQNGKKDAIPVERREEADLAIENNLKSERLNLLLKKTEEEASTDPKVITNRENYNKAISELPGVKLTTASGKVLNFTSNEISNFVSKYKRVTGKSAEDIKFGGGQADVIDPNSLTPNEKEMYSILENSSKNPDAARTLNAVISRHKPLVQKFAADKRTYDDVFRTKLLEKTGKYIPKLQAIVVSDKDGAQSRDRLETIANQALSIYTGIAGSQPGGAAELSTDQARAGREWLTGKDKGDIMYSKLSQGGKNFLVMNKGNQEIVIPLTPQLMTNLPKSKDDMTSVEEDVRETQSYFDGNTNPSNDPTKSYFQRPAFPNVKKLSVTADLSKNSTNAYNYLNLNIKLPSGWKNIQLDNFPMDVKNAQSQISGFTDTDILNIYLQSDKVPQAWKDEIKKTFQ
jgi:hypothetical protein